MTKALNTTRTCLIVSLQYPPSSMAGVHRARHLCKHLSYFGWKPALISADPKDMVGATDLDLLRISKADIDHFRVQAIPLKLSQLVGVSDIGLRTIFDWRRVFRKAVFQVKPEVVLLTSSPAYPMLLTSWIKKEFGIPIILDFQDPWVSLEGASRPKLSKGGLAHLLATRLEPQAIRDASYITSVSERQNSEMADKYPWLDRTKMAAIPIGGDPDDFDAMRTAPLTNPVVPLDSRRINLSYVGTFLPRAGPIVETLFLALKALRDETPQIGERLLLNFVGTSNQPRGGGNHLITPIARRMGVSDLVREVPERVPFLEALNILSNSHGLILVGSDEPHYTASKTFPALMSGTPYISIFHNASSAHQILIASGGGFAHSFKDTKDLQCLVTPLKENLAKFALAKLDAPVSNPRAYEAYTAHNIARQFSQVFDAVSS